MGNCPRKKALDPNDQPLDVAKPPAGVPPPRKIHTTQQKERTSSTFQEIHFRHERCDYQHRKWRHSKSQKENDSVYINNGLPSNPRDITAKMEDPYHASRLNCFCHKILEAATRKFSEKNIIGQGGFGEVYIGYINSWTMTPAKRKDGIAIAVKKLRRKGFQGLNEWKNEMDFLSRLNHPNVIKLIGYCSEGEHRMLVYEYMTEGSLEDHLLSKNESVLNWNQRIKIALGAARGLEYLHTYWTPIIHRDVKASNVLLDDDFNAKLSDFGIAKFGPLGEKSHISTRVLGTKGYFAPEYIATGRLTLKTDVYSFGVVMLEIFLGQDAVNKYPNSLAGMWAKPYLSNKQELHRVVDQRLGKNIRMEEVKEFAQIILRCLGLEPKNRPTMTQVVADLEQLELHMGGNQDFLRLSTRKKRAPFEHYI